MRSLILVALLALGCATLGTASPRADAGESAPAVASAASPSSSTPSPSSPAAPSRVVRIGLYQNEPKVFTDAAGRPAGFFVDLVDAIGRAEGWRVVWVPIEWEAGLEALENGRLDLMPDAAITEERTAVLGATTESRDPYTAGHQRRVAQLACTVAVELAWPEERVGSLRTAALLHDIGKIVVPAEILSRPGRLTDTEMSLVRQHAAASADTVADIFQGAIAETIRQHHERLDGSGYPTGLRGEEILPEARVLAVADVCEAMLSHRPYRPALPLEEAVSELESGAGSRYDATVVGACVRLLRDRGFAFVG